MNLKNTYEKKMRSIRNFDDLDDYLKDIVINRLKIISRNTGEPPEFSPHKHNKNKVFYKCPNTEGTASFEGLWKVFKVSEEDNRL